jgi:hypothetical protein
VDPNGINGYSPCMDVVENEKEKLQLQMKTILTICSLTILIYFAGIIYQVIF